MTTKAEKRVLIAKDVLKQLKLKRVRATPGTYCVFDKAHFEQSNAVQLQAELEKQVKPCEVCALGACFVGAVRKFNDITTLGAGIGVDMLGTVHDEPNVYYMRSYLNRWFTPDQLGEIECAFEGWDLDGSQYGSTEARAFYKKYRSPAKRMAAIMRNIVRNKGTFVL